MSEAKVVEIAAITIPVFAITLIGILLQKHRVLTTEGKKSMSWITYNLALPAMIFYALMRPGSGSLFSADLFYLSLITIGLTGGLLWTIATLLKLSPTKRAAMTYCSYWGNNGYMGFPLAAYAIEETGLGLAAVINGMATPVFIISGLFLMYRAQKASGSSSEQRNAIKKQALKTVLNPVMMTLLFGSLLAFVRTRFLVDVEWHGSVRISWTIFMELVTMLKHLGLPLALILVGSSLTLEEVSRDRLPLVLTVLGKLLVAPAITYGALTLFFSHMAYDQRVAIVLLNAVPGAVASFIISERMEMEGEFVSSSLVISTALSVVTLPLWLYIIL